MIQDGDELGFMHSIRREGASAYWDDVPFKRNPYRKYGGNYHQWNLGWKQAEAEVMNAHHEDSCNNPESD